MTKYCANIILNGRSRRISNTQPSTVKEKIIVSDNTSTDNLLKQLIDVTKEQNNLLSELKDLSNKPKIIDEIVMVLAAITLFSTLVMIYMSIYGHNQFMWIITVIFALIGMSLLYVRLFQDYCRNK